MNGKFLLAIDQGTSSSRAVLYDSSVRPLATAQREFEQIYPRPGWVEHDAEAIWESQLSTAREAIAGAGLAAGDIAAIGITNQRETVVAWDRETGDPVSNAIVWQDRRTASMTAALRGASNRADPELPTRADRANRTHTELLNLRRDSGLTQKKECRQLCNGKLPRRRRVRRVPDESDSNSGWAFVA